MGRRLCRHCKRSPDYRPRGLCWACYYSPGVRDQYPPISAQEAGAKGGRAYRPSEHRRA
jgi:hypothetical protein